MTMVPISGKDAGADAEYAFMWKVEGHVSTESGTAGPETWFYRTESAMTLPDLTSVFYPNGSSNGRGFYLIDSIEYLGALPAVECRGDGPWGWDPPDFIRKVER
jgi:hypothetical protein